jgi:hypothetical protein
LQHTGLSIGHLTPGMMVWTIGDPARVGTFRGLAENVGWTWAAIAFPNAAQRIPIEQIELDPLGPDKPTAVWLDL